MLEKLETRKRQDCIYNIDLQKLIGQSRQVNQADTRMRLQRMLRGNPSGKAPAIICAKTKDKRRTGTSGKQQEVSDDRETAKRAQETAEEVGRKPDTRCQKMLWRSDGEVKRRFFFKNYSKATARKCMRGNEWREILETKRHTQVVAKGWIWSPSRLKMSPGVQDNIQEKWEMDMESGRLQSVDTALVLTDCLCALGLGTHF